MKNKDHAQIETEIKKTFITECLENLSISEDFTLALEKNISNPDYSILNDLFRSLHTIKGGGGFMGMNHVASLSHEMETLIGLAKNKKIKITIDFIEALLAGIDKLKYILEQYSNDQNLEHEISDEIQTIKRVIERYTLAENQTIEFKSKIKTDEVSNFNFDIKNYNLKNIEEKFEFIFEASIDLIDECKHDNITPIQFLKKLSSVGEIIDIYFDLDRTFIDNNNETDDFLIMSFLLATVFDSPSMVTDSLNLQVKSFKFHNLKDLIEETDLQKQQEPKLEKLPFLEKKNDDLKISLTDNLPHEKNIESVQKNPAQSNIKISVNIIEKLMNLASELVLLRNQNTDAISSRNLDKLTAVSKKLNTITTSIQGTIMQTRMQPIGNIFNLFKRIIRNLSIKLGKEVDLKIYGSNVELDKQIIDTITDPLTHLIRNSLDHGIESPEERKNLGKPVNGTLILQAYHHAGRVVIQIIDDGPGINPEILKSLAVSQNLITPKQANSMSHDDALNLIFLPDLSSAKQLTDISGRGIGMNVVKEKFEKLGGLVEVVSKKNIGTTITISLPLTLAIMPALIISEEQHFFAIPQVNILEVIWLHGTEVFQKLETTCNYEVYRLRNRLLPILRLSNILKLHKTYVDKHSRKRMPEKRLLFPDRRKIYSEVTQNRRLGDPERRSSESNNLFIIVIKLGLENYGLIVDKIIDTQEIVVKPIHTQLKRYNIYSGLTFLGDGGIAMILDVAKIATKSAITLGNAEMNYSISYKEISYESIEILVYNIGGKEIFIYPLFMIKRVNKLSLSEIKTINNLEFIKFDNLIIPLFRIDNLLPDLKSNYDNNNLYVIIPNSVKPIGILISNIIDTIRITEDDFIETIQTHKSFIASLLYKNNMTVFWDFCSLIENLKPDIFNIYESNTIKCLIISSSKIQTSIISFLLRSNHINSLNTDNMVDTINILKNNYFDLIIFDSAFISADSYEIVRVIKSHEKFSNTQLFAIYYNNNPETLKQLYEAGFNNLFLASDKNKMIELIFKKFSNNETISNTGERFERTGN